MSSSELISVCRKWPILELKLRPMLSWQLALFKQHRWLLSLYLPIHSSSRLNTLLPSETLAINWRNKRSQLTIALPLVNWILSCSRHHPLQVIVLSLHCVAFCYNLQVVKHQTIFFLFKCLHLFFQRIYVLLLTFPASCRTFSILYSSIFSSSYFLSFDFCILSMSPTVPVCASTRSSSRFVLFVFSVVSLNISECIITLGSSLWVCTAITFASIFLRFTRFPD